MKSVAASVVGRDLARAGWLWVPQTPHASEMKWFENKSRHGDEVCLQRWQPSKGVPVAFRTPLVLRGVWGCHSQHPRLPLQTGMKSPSCIYLLPEQLLEHSLFARSLSKSTDFCLSAPCVLCSLQQTQGMFLQGAGTLSCPWSWSFTAEACDASSLSSFMMFLPSPIPASRRKSSI